MKSPAQGRGAWFFIVPWQIEGDPWFQGGRVPARGVGDGPGFHLLHAPKSERLGLHDGFGLVSLDGLRRVGWFS